MTDANDKDLHLRRERGRKAQAAFRKRKAQQTQNLAQENHQLIQGINHIIRNIHGDERPDLLAAISNASAIAQLTSPPAPKTSTNIKYHHRSSLPSASLISATPDRLTNIWLNPLQYSRISLPPTDIIAYLGTKSKTLAGSLFWSMLEHSQTTCTRDHASPAVLIRRGLAHSKSISEIDTSFIEAMINARVEYKYKGSISPKYAPAAEADLPIVVHKRVELDYREMGKDPDSWLSCLGIEQRLRRVVGESALRAVEAAALGEGEDGLVVVMDRAKCRLYDTAVCFGDGPRWDAGVVDGILVEVLGALVRYVLGNPL